MSTLIEQWELAGFLKERVIGRRITGAHGNSLTLDNGTKIEIEGSGNCCAWGDATLSELRDSEHVITGVHSDGDEDGEKITLHLLTDMGTAMTITQEWDSSNGYYIYGLYLTVTGTTRTASDGTKFKAYPNELTDWREENQ